MIAAVEVTPDFKPEPRIVDPDALKRAMRVNVLENAGRCWACKRARAQDPHHLIFKSDRGDDVIENIIPLCVNCHVTFHRGLVADRFDVAANIGKSLPLTTKEYVLRKKGVVQGQDFLRRRYRTGVPKRMAKRLAAEGVARRVADV